MHTPTLSIDDPPALPAATLAAATLPSTFASLTTSTAPPKPMRGRDLALSLLGLLALGGAAALGMPPSAAALRLTPSVVLVDLAALALTAPALIAMHQFLRLAAPPEALAAGLGRALIHGGRVAAGLAVVVLFFSATTSLSVVALVCSLLAVGVFTSATACVELSAAERRAGHMVAGNFSLLLLGWLALSWMIALRVGVDVAGWVLTSKGGF